jgi:hypothetical protein
MTCWWCQLWADEIRLQYIPFILYFCEPPTHIRIRCRLWPHSVPSIMIEVIIVFHSSNLPIRPILHRSDKWDAKFNITMGLQRHVFDKNQPFGMTFPSVHREILPSVKFFSSKIDGVLLFCLTSRLLFLFLRLSTVWCFQFWIW